MWLWLVAISLLVVAVVLLALILGVLLVRGPRRGPRGPRGGSGSAGPTGATGAPMTGGYLTVAMGVEGALASVSAGATGAWGGYSGAYSLDLFGALGSSGFVAPQTGWYVAVFSCPDIITTATGTSTVVTSFQLDGVNVGTSGTSTLSGAGTMPTTSCSFAGQMSTGQLLSTVSTFTSSNNSGAVIGQYAGLNVAIQIN